jgi:ribonuclease HI
LFPHSPALTKPKSQFKILIKPHFALSSFFFPSFKISRLKLLNSKDLKALAKHLQKERSIQLSHKVNNSNNNSTSHMAPQKYYAVQNGRETGVYNSWNDCQKMTSGYSGAVFKSFGSYSEAQSFANSSSGYNSSRSNGSKSSGSGYGGSGYSRSVYSSSGYNSSEYSSSSGTSGSYYSDNIGYTSSTFIPSKSSGKITKTSSGNVTNSSYRGSKGKQTVVYTDGASSNNGYASARAGYGVFYGDNDYRNKSAALSSNEPQTNQRAELHAIVDALRSAVDSPDSDSKNLRIMTDSKYSRDCLTSWADKWESNGYISSSGREVQNQDLIKNGRSLMKQLESQGGSIEIEHVKGHADNYGNNQADKLAVQGRNK